MRDGYTDSITEYNYVLRNLRGKVKFMSVEPKAIGERPIARGIRETAQVVGVSAGFIRKAIDAGELKPTRKGRRVLVKDADLVEWLNRNDDPRLEAA